MKTKTYAVMIRIRTRNDPADQAALRARFAEFMPSATVILPDRKKLSRHPHEVRP